MHTGYDDILSRIPEEPQWFDEHAVPRFCAFSPREVADIYADQVALVEITCQCCERPFRVAFSDSRTRRYMPGGGAHDLAERVRNGSLHYGDPPNIGCCAAGPTMNSEPRRVLEFWSRHDRRFVDEAGAVTEIAAYMEWRRDPTLEISIDDPDAPQAADG